MKILVVDDEKLLVKGIKFNLEKRLGLLYSGHFSFQCGREGDNYSSYLSITINETEI